MNRISNTAIRALVALLAALVPLLAHSQELDHGPRTNGTGAFPVTAVHASAWFGAHSGNDAEKRIVLMVYFSGSPGWHDKNTDFKWDVTGEPVTISMNVGGTPILVSYSAETATVRIQEDSFNLGRANVYLVSDIDGPDLEVHALGTYDLTFEADKNPAIALLQRSAEVRSALLGRPAKDSETTTVAGEPSQAARLDAEGLHLLKSDDPKDKVRACESFRAAAEMGYADSQYRLGHCYQIGSGGEQDQALANAWYQKAALQGHVDAQYKLGHSYLVGRGTEPDIHRALEWFEEAANNGDAEAMQNIGWIYGTGQGGIEPDSRAAFKWFLLAAQNGELGSQFEIARRYREGDGVEADMREAYAWFLVVAGSKRLMRPADWQQVETALTIAGSSLTDAQKATAISQSKVWLRELSALYIDKLGN